MSASGPTSARPPANGADFANQLLQSFGDDEIARLRPHMAHVNLVQRTSLKRQNQTLNKIYLPGTAVMSLLAGEDESVVQVAMIGQEGVAGFSQQEKSAFMRLIVVSEGDAIAINATELHAAVARSLHLSTVFLDYQSSLTGQIARTALSLAAFTVKQRLARLLLMYGDRVGAEIRLSHEFIAFLLHVRRPSVTQAMQSLEAAGAIGAERGRILILIRDQLITIAALSYGVAESTLNIRVLDPNSEGYPDHSGLSVATEFE